MMKTITTVDLIERNDKDVWGGPPNRLVVESHWNRSEYVVLVLDGVRVTLSAKDLHRAIVRATQ